MSPPKIAITVALVGFHVWVTLAIVKWFQS
jgi:hypothetical protein